MTALTTNQAIQEAVQYAFLLERRNQLTLRLRALDTRIMDMQVEYCALKGQIENVNATIEARHNALALRPALTSRRITTRERSDGRHVAFCTCGAETGPWLKSDDAYAELYGHTCRA